MVTHRIRQLEIESPFVISGNGELMVRQGFVEAKQNSEAQGDLKRAIELEAKLVAAIERHYGPAHNRLADRLNALGCLYYRNGQFSCAQDCLDRSLQIRIRNLGDNHADVASSRNNLAAALREQGNYRLAEYHYKAAIGVLERCGDSKKRDLAQVLEFYAVLLEKTGRIEERKLIIARARALRS
jgi:tetratricopeptide (TPR) repeat protein